MGRSRFTMAAAGLLATSISFPWDAVRAATLPIPCVAGVCGANNPFVALGKGSASQSGSTLTVNQTSQNATFNWQSFNISADGTVNFVQPNSTAVALNRIFDANPTQIFGALNANGRVYLLNGNGIIFGGGAQVNVGSLIASTLNTSIDSTANNYSLLTPGVTGQAAFQQFVDPTSGVLLNHSILIQQGATLQTPEGGQILVFAPTIVNQGTISTPGGQTVLAAGTQVYLASTDATIRGLLVEVAADNNIQTSVTNGSQAANANTTNPAQLVGQIIADRGNVTLAGLAVNQYGRISATTSVNENGSIRLQAGTGTVTGNGSGSTGSVIGLAGGTLTLAPNSVTQVTLDTADTSTTVDSVAQPKSDITLLGATVDILNNSTVRATSGTIEAQAAQNQAELYNATGMAGSGAGLTSTQDGSRVYIAPGANLDVSGASVTLPVSSNIVSAQLRGTELADSPLQQNGPLHGQTVYFDIRDHGKSADGTTWEGTPLANVSGEIAAIQRNVAERNLTAGTITLQSQGDVIVSPGSTLNISGGAINYTGGIVNTTMLLTTTGKSVPIGSADPNALYVGVLDGATVSDAKWGTTRTYGNVTGQYEQGYVQGMDAGTLNLSAPKFVLDGNVNGSTTAGIYQRLPTSAPIQGTTYFLGYDGQQDLYRNYDEVPKGTTLNIGGAGEQVGSGVELVTANVVLQSGDVLAGLRNADGSVFNPLTDPLPASYASSVLRPDLLGGQIGFSQVSILTDGHFLQPATTDVRLPAGGSFAVEAGTIDIEGSIDAPGGTISASAVTTATSGTNPAGLTLGPQAALTARGEWVNDSPSLYGGGTNTWALFTAGGTVILSATANLGSSSILTLAPGSLIDVSGGAQLTNTGALVDGAGGKINLTASASANPSNPVTQTDEPAQLELGATLRGYGLSEGGKLSISAGAICIAAADCSAGDLNTLWLTPALFSNGGFGSYNITADQGGLSLEPGTTLLLQQQSLQLASNFSRLGNSAELPVLASTVLLPDLVRQPVNLTLTQNVALNAQTPGTSPENSVTVTADTPSLVIGAGAVIAADPGAALSLASNTRILVDGTLSAPGGSISLTLHTPTLTDYAPTQGIWLGSSGVLDVHGVPQIQLSDNGLRSGTVLNGGNVSITATDGYINLLPGSLIDVSGATGTVDVVQFNRPAYSEQIGSAGGTVSLQAAEGMILGGAFKAAGGAAGPAGAQPAGGSLSVALDDTESLLGLTSNDAPSTLQITVSQSLAPLVVAEGSAVPDSLAGNAYVSADVLNNSGFNSVTLHAGPYTPANSSAGPGEIAFSGNVNLNLPQQITLDAGIYSVSPGTTTQIHAPYVEFGNSDQNSYINLGTTYALPALLQSGTGTLKVSGDFIELYGWMALQGIDQAYFNSTADLRLTGLQDLAVNAVSPLGGGLFSAGDVELSASQIYPSTLSQFEIAAGVSTGVNPTVPATGSITINPASASNTNTDLLSAGGAVTLLAGTVNQQGVLRAPFGTIDMEANTINLAPGSLTSTSAEGLTIPFGTTQGGFDWVYGLPSNYSIVFGTDGVPLPSQHVILNGTNVNIKSGAVVDVSGGGDLQAYEWLPGVGGTLDVLSQITRPGQFAILPTLKANVAPYDPTMSQGDGLQVGQSVYLSGAPGLPAGNYILLPARYALLPGAFLVSATSGYQDIQPGQTYAAPGGGTIVSGYETIAGTSFGASRTSGFTVVPRSVVLAQAQYTTTSANTFFTTQAAAANVDPSRLPEDSGVLDLLASASLSLDGSLRADSANKGLGAAVDISSSQIVIGASASTPIQTGQLLVTTGSLEQLGAQTLLIGGQLSSTGAITTTSQSVTVASGASLTAPEVLLTASDQVTVSNGASITGSGTAATTRAYTLTGDGGFLSVAAGPQATVTRTGEDPNAGVLTLAAGSALTANQGSIYLDASQNVVTQGTITANGGDLALQSTQIAIGTPPQGASSAPATVLDPNLLTTGGLRNVLLSGNQGIDFYGSVNLSAQNLTLDAPAISGYGAGGDAAAISASGTLTLTNSQPAVAQPASSQGSGTIVPPVTGSGSLTLNAANIDLGAGALSVSGFNTLALNAQNAITGTASGSLTLVNAKPATGNPATGNLAITASQLTTAAGVSTALTANVGAVTILAPSQVAPPTPVTALGGSLAITGTSIELGTKIVMPSGNVSLVTTGGGATPGADLLLDSDAGITVAGITRQYNGATVPAPGGTIALSSAGNVILAAGSTLDVSAAMTGTGGSLAISAGAGTVTAAGSVLGAGTGAQGASFSVDAQSFDFASLNGALANAFSGARGFRLRGDSASCAASCDLVVASGTTIAAHSISLEADNGSVEIDGNLNASGTSGGSVTLAASNNITVNGAIGANATVAGGKGGHVEVDLGNQSTGSLRLNTGSIINVAGGGADSSGDAGLGGTVLLRIPGALVLNQATNGGTGIVLSGSITGSTGTTLEAVNVYNNAAGGLIDSTGVISADAIASINTDITNFMANQSLQSYSAQLGQALGSSFSLVPGVEIDAGKTADDTTGSLTLNTPWDLSGWRFGTGSGDTVVPGVLTLRATGGVTIDSQLSDGFTSATSSTLLAPSPTNSENSWSYRIAAGADLAAANPLTVFTDSADAADVNITAGTAGARGAATPHMVRTGNGFIDVSASGDFMLGSPDPNNPGNWLSGSQLSLLYTAGVPGTGLVISGSRGSGSLSGLPYPVDGGNINITVNGDVTAQAPTQFVNAWLWRVGPSVTTGLPSSAWTVNFQDFQQGIGALGGGDILVRAGGNVTNLSASIPTVGIPVGATIATSTLQVEGGGSLTVDAGGSILGGSYYTGQGTLTLNAGGSVGTATAVAGDGTVYNLAPLLGLGAASAAVTARGAIQLAGIVDPMLLNTGSATGTPTGPSFTTYSPTSTVSLVAAGGDVILDDESAALTALLRGSFLAGNLSPTSAELLTGEILDIAPPTLDIAALSGSINIGHNLVLTPAPTGNLQLFADQNVLLNSAAESIAIVVPDADPASLPTAAHPGGVAIYGDILNDALSLTNATTPDEYATVPVHLGDPNPVQIVARTGNIDFTSTSPGSTDTLWSAKPVQLVAGKDILDLSLVAQNLTPSDVTSITAGRDINYPQSRDLATGTISANTDQITVGGPGSLELSAGRNVTLGTSEGVSTVGNLNNLNLAAGGARVSILAGIADNPVQISAFITKYVDGTTDFDQELVSFVETTTGSGAVEPAQAKLIFAGMTQRLQTAFVEQVFFDLLRTNGRSAAAAGPTHNDFSGAYTALQTLFPGANPNLAAGETDPYAGNIDLYFSKVYTDQGGNISLLAPGGEVDAGLAQPPSAFGVGKAPDQLGIVVQTSGSIDSFTYGDFQVNQSRVFASEGGDILVWSTEGNIDAGRGSKTSLSAAPATVNIDPQSGAPVVTLSAPITGSGIQALAVTPGTTAGNVDLFAPHGVVNANDAGIVAGNLTIAATAVLGTNNIVVTGTSVGVPVPVTGLGAAAVGASSSAASAVSTSTNFSEGREDPSKTPAADTALGWLDVFVLGFGEETCKAEDAECMKRQSLKQ